MLTQLVYTSRPRFDARCPDGHKILREIAENARQNGPHAEISGVMVVGQDWLAQILEGEATALAPIFRQILADDRYDALRLVDMRMTSERQFGSDNRIVAPDAARDIPHSRLAALGAEDFLKIATNAMS